ncbi:MAG: NifU family protein [Deltaproteobacteria bacterium]|nr:NifU family protein [Deltaproteobacteria bacterium]
MREALKQVIDDVLNPLLQSDSSSIELLDVSEDEVTVRVTGKVVGDQCAIHIKKTIPTAKRRA